MRTTENKWFGVIGINVELSFIELLLIREQLGIIAESSLLEMQRHTPHRAALQNIVNFCEKLIYSNLEEGMQKAGDELFSPLGTNAPLPLAPDEDAMSPMSDEDVKDVWGLGDIQEEAH